MPKPRRRRDNPIQTAVSEWINSQSTAIAGETTSWQDDLPNSAPKRFTIYEPMALLPSGSFTSPLWIATLNRCDQTARAVLWFLILTELSKGAKGCLTHLAINDGIPLHKNGEADENIWRSPSGLRMLHGDFGPAPTDGEQATSSDFEKALWVATKQNGIHQTWAPRWTMFSRGNIKEKARVLDFGRLSSSLEHSWAADLYAGIGYFVFSYAALGLRVLCWEINPWSVEGLRRGAEMNRWSVKVVQGQQLDLPLDELMSGGEQIVVFLEDNQKSMGRIKEMRTIGLAEEVVHVNCGFLPTSEPTWEQAWGITSGSSEAWLHLHENVGVNDTESRKKSIQNIFEGWSTGEGALRTPNVEHVELVKTFAPGVWHCVFDVHITTSNAT